MSIICPGLPYQETLELVNIVPIVDFITGLCSNTFDIIIKYPEHRLNRLIQFSGPSRYALRCNRCFIVPKCKTDHFRNSFIVRSCIDNIYTQIFSPFIMFFILLYLRFLVLYTHFIGSIIYFVNMQFSLQAAMYWLLNCLSIYRASDISQKKKEIFVGFSGANSRKNWLISREKSQNLWKIGRFRGILMEKSQISKDFQGQILRKIGRFHGKFQRETSPRNNQ